MPSLGFFRRLDFAALAPHELGVEMAAELKRQGSDRKPELFGNVATGVLLVAMLVAFGVVLWANFLPAIVHPDANGYWAQGARIFATGSSVFRPESDAQYIGMHWLLMEDETLVARYPPVYPVLVGFVWWTMGWEASVLVNPVLGVGALVGVFLVTRQVCLMGAVMGAKPVTGARLVTVGGANIAALAAVAGLGMNAAFTVHALTSIAHMPVAFLLVWGIYFLLRWAASQRLWTLAVAGFVLGLIPGTRYPDAVVAIGVGMFLLVTVWRMPGGLLGGGWKHVAAACGGAFVAVLPLLVRNQLVLGGFWRTGYALTNEQTGFSFEYFTQHAMGYLQLLAGSGLGPMFVLGLLGMVCLVAVKQARAAGLMLVGSVVPITIVYMSYYWAAGIGGGGGMQRGGGAMNAIAGGVAGLLQPPPGGPDGALPGGALPGGPGGGVMGDGVLGDGPDDRRAGVQGGGRAGGERAGADRAGIDRAVAGGPAVAPAGVMPGGAGPGNGPAGGGPGGGGPGGGNSGAMRFFVPIVPLFAIAGMSAIAMVTAGLGTGARVAAVMVPLALHGVLYGPTLASELAEQRSRKAALAAGTTALVGVAEPGAVVVASPQFLQQLDFLQRWKLADASLVGSWQRAGARMMSAVRGEDSPSPMQPAKQRWQASLYPGTQVEKQRKFLADVERWAMGKGVYVICGSSEIGRMLPGVPREAIEEVGRVKASEFGGRKQAAAGNTRVGGRRGGGGPFGPAVTAGDDIVIAKVRLDRVGKPMNSPSAVAD